MPLPTFTCMPLKSQPHINKMDEPSNIKQVVGLWSKCILYFLMIVVCFRFAAKCDDAAACRLQVMGHIYPATFMVALAWSWHSPKHRTAECWAMIAFWLMYWIIDAVQQNGVDFSKLKIVQHYAFTLLVGMCGIYRLCRGPIIDTFIMSVLVSGFLLFVYMHPQPNTIGETMHLVCAGWLCAFLVAYLFKCNLEGSAFMIMAATSFVCSQLALTSVAVGCMDTVAYFVLATLLGFFVHCIFF
jgi:hypothetical protein